MTQGPRTPKYITEASVLLPSVSRSRQFGASKIRHRGSAVTDQHPAMSEFLELINVRQGDITVVLWFHHLIMLSCDQLRPFRVLLMLRIKFSTVAFPNAASAIAALVWWQHRFARPVHIKFIRTQQGKTFNRTTEAVEINHWWSTGAGSCPRSSCRWNSQGHFVTPDAS